jgi:hypothetical protein
LPLALVAAIIMKGPEVVMREHSIPPIPLLSTDVTEAVMEVDFHRQNLDEDS